jgi:hypothetical protein
VVQSSHPSLGLVGEAGGQVSELVLQPALEGRAAVVDEDTHLLENFSGALDGEPGTQGGEQGRVCDLVALDVIGQHEREHPETSPPAPDTAQ